MRPKTIYRSDMSRWDGSRIHRIPARSPEGRRIIREGRVVNWERRLPGVKCLEITLGERGIENVEFIKSSPKPLRVGRLL